MKGRAYVINSSHADVKDTPAPVHASYLDLDEEKQLLVDTQTPAIIEDLEEFTPDATRLDTVSDLPPPPPKMQSVVRKQESIPLTSSKSAIVPHDFRGLEVSVRKFPAVSAN
ncbi:hypothetical protein EON65_36410 [archaeon]|nr:MAG: hypothetical protein EON65_36410 [archaeon]